MIIEMTWLIWGVDLPLDLPISALTIEIRNDHSDELAGLGEGRSGHISFNNRNETAYCMFYKIIILY